MKKLLLCLAFVSLFGLVFAQNFQIAQNSYQKVSVSFTTENLSVEDLSIPEGDFSVISLPGYGVSYNPGLPQLPQLTKLIEIPVCDSVAVTVLNAQYQEYDAAALGIRHPLFPSQATVAKNNTHPVFSYNASAYGTDAFFSQPLVQVEKVGVKRNVALANVSVSPVEYNPVTQKIRICTHFDVEFTFVNADMVQTIALQKFASPMFSLDNRLVMNKMQEVRNEYSSSPIRYLIIGNSMFANNYELETFVAWKRRLGYLVDVVFTSDANVGSTTTSIKNYIQSVYDAATPANPAPTFILLLGDREQLPAFSTQVSGEDHITDLYYATLSGDDYLPDCYYGRLSATNNDQLSHQIEKILMYEQYTMPDPSYLGKAVLIAGTDDHYGPTHANGQINYINNYYINSSNPAYSDVMVHLYNCSSQAAQIRSEVSAGAGWVNYTAHGGETSWADPSFTTAHVAQLQNADKYGLMIGNCCQSGNFKTGECFGEALLRAEKKGAMGYIGASNNSYWGEDFYWAVGYRSNINANPTYSASALGAYDKIFHTHNENHDVWYSTIAGMMTGGNLTVQNTSSSLKQYYWEIYHCFGDPSVRPYLGVPSPMSVSASEVIMNNATSYSVQVAPYAYVALTQGNTLIAAGFADENGNVTFAIQSIEPGEYELVAMAQNYIPYFQPIQVIVPNGPFVVPITVETAANTVFTEGTTVMMNLSLSNVGVSNATQVYATLTPGMSMTMLQDSVYVGSMDVNATENKANAFSFLMPAVEDFFNVPFTLRVHWNDTTIVRNVNVRAKLPKVVMTACETRKNGQAVSSYSPGDELQFVFTNANQGHAAVLSGSVDLTCNYSGVKVLTDLFSISGMNPNDQVQNTFVVTIADTVPPKSLVPLYYHTCYGNVHRIDTLRLLVGGDLEDFETGDFTQYNWTMNNRPWIITNSGAYAGTYAARSAQNLSNNYTSKMSITLSCASEFVLSFYRKVSSENGYDKFFLYVDNDMKDEASGNVDWTYVTTTIPAGTHTIKFSYEKDYSQAQGQDCAWIDNVSLPCTGILVIEDMQDPTIASVQAYTMPRATVYPNPTSEWVNVQSEQPLQRVVLYDLNGRMVKMMRPAEANQCQFNMSDVSAGFYMLQVTFGDRQVQNFKIIKK